MFAQRLAGHSTASIARTRSGGDALHGLDRRSPHQPVALTGPQVVLLVNEPTLLPVLLPLASSSTLAARTTEQIAAVLAAPRHRLPRSSTRNGIACVDGVMIEFSSLAEVYRDGDPGPDLKTIALRLATTPCGPLYRKNVSPDCDLAAFLASLAI